MPATDSNLPEQPAGHGLASGHCSGSSDGPDAACCRECGCTMDLVHDDDGDIICCDCLFEEETNDINQP